MAAEGPGRRELAQLVADHLLGDEHGYVLPAVVDGDRVPDHVREDRGRARPGADHPLLVVLVHRLDAAHQPRLDERPFFGTATHLLALLLSAPAAADDQTVGFLVLAARALAERGHAPRRDRMPAAFGLPLAAAVRMVDGVHRRAAHRRPLAPPPAPSCLAAGDVLVVHVTDLSDRCAAGQRHPAHLAGGKPEHAVALVLRDELHARARAAGDLAAPAGLQLDV